jgi:predicted DNA-binding transcriptional regulator YafY
MYHPTTRLLTLLELLQSRGQLSGAELARRLRSTTVLPAAVRERVHAVQAHLALDSIPQEGAADSTLIVLLSEAAARGQGVLLHYRSQRGETTERVVDPYGLVNWTQSWYVVGYCHLRRGLRVFRLDRIQSAAQHDARFVPPADFDSLGYVLRRVGGWGSAFAVEVVLGLSMDEARRKMPPRNAALELAPEGVVLHTRATELDGFARFLLRLGCSLVVRQPPELKEALRRVAREMMHMADRA